MAASSSGLSRSQINFLQDNCVVYDPFYRECYTDFSGLENCQLILWGEVHNSSILKAIQRKFLEIIIGNQPACVLDEGLAPGVTLNAAERPDWQRLPSTLQVRGADVRYQWPSAALLEWERLNQRVMQLELAGKELASDKFRQIAAILNGHFRSNSSGIDLAKKVFLVSGEVLQTVENLYQRSEKEQEQRGEEIVKIQAQMDALLGNRTIDATVVRSNQGLFQEIEKACKQFSKVIAFWGKGHVVCDTVLRRALDQARVRYVILMPNAQREKEAIDEINWAAGNLPTFDLTVEDGEERFTFTVPMLFQSYFHPAIQKIFQMEIEEPIVLDILKLLELAKQGKTWTFPPGKKIHFEHAPLTDYHRLEELCHGLTAETTLTEAQNSALKSQIVSMLNNILMVGGLKITSLIFDGSILADQTCLQNKLTLILSSDKPFHLTWADSQSVGYAEYLFQEMKRLNMKRYSVHPHERLFFLDLSAEEAEHIIRSPNEIVGWLNSKLPPQTHLSLTGQIDIGSAVITQFKDSPEVNGIVLMTETGFTFTLS